jgi:thioredoxin reductase
MEEAGTFDVIVIGGGPAGLSAAMLLGRCRRRVALFDEGRPRNEMSPEVHGYLGLPAISPGELLAIGRSQLAKYPNVRIQQRKVEEVDRCSEGFRVVLRGGAACRSRALVIATGLIDRLPDIAGVEEYYGKSVFPCPFCDGWENADRELGALGSGNDVAELAIELRLWSERVSCFIHGEAPDDDLTERMAKAGIRSYRTPAVRMLGEAGRLSGLELQDGESVACEALFLVEAQFQHHDFLEKMGCRLNESGQVECDDTGRTPTPGLLVAGNARRGLQMAMVAAADGIKCGASANEWLLRQDEERGIISHHEPTRDGQRTAALP